MDNHRTTVGQVKEVRLKVGFVVRAVGAPPEDLKLLHRRSPLLLDHLECLHRLLCMSPPRRLVFKNWELLGRRLRALLAQL